MAYGEEANPLLPELVKNGGVKAMPSVVQGVRKTHDVNHEWHQHLLVPGGSAIDSCTVAHDGLDLLACQLQMVEQTLNEDLRQLSRIHGLGHNVNADKTLDDVPVTVDESDNDSIRFAKARGSIKNQRVVMTGRGLSSISWSGKTEVSSHTAHLYLSNGWYEFRQSRASAQPVA